MFTGSMSLTHFLSIDEAKQLINANFRNPIKRAGAKLVVEPTKGVGVDFGAVGTAYDYWLRCEIKRNDPDIYKTFIGYRECVEPDGPSRVIAKHLDRHVKALSEFLTGSLGLRKKLFEACLFLAKFETSYRSGYPIMTLEVARQDVEELGRIAAGTNLESFMTGHVVLNPVVGVEGSKLTIGADGDVIVDGALIDLKTSSQLTLMGNLRQLIGYWALNELGGHPYEISRVGVYYPRFNYSVDFSPDDLMTPVEQSRVLNFFQSKLGKIKPSKHAAVS